MILIEIAAGGIGFKIKQIGRHKIRKLPRY